MLCPQCKHETSVIDSRDIDSAVIKRRRECDDCSYRFTTYERLEPVNFNIIKRNGSTQPYNRDKVKKGIMLAAQKRTITEQEIDDLIDRIESKLVEHGTTAIPSKAIGELVIKELRSIDEVSYLRFASVYKAFTSAQSFKKELEKLTK